MRRIEQAAQFVARISSITITHFVSSARLSRDKKQLRYAKHEKPCLPLGFRPHLSLFFAAVHARAGIGAAQFSLLARPHAIARDIQMRPAGERIAA